MSMCVCVLMTECVESEVVKMSTVDEAEATAMKAKEDSKPVKTEYKKANVDIKRRATQLKEELSVLAIKSKMHKVFDNLVFSVCSLSIPISILSSFIDH